MKRFMNKSPNLGVMEWWNSGVMGPWKTEAKFSDTPILRYLIFRASVFSILAFLSTLTVSAVDRPNILFILVDDLGWRDLACYGHELYETPNIDKLASQSMRFTDSMSLIPQRRILTFIIFF